MTNRIIQQVWKNSYEDFLSSGHFLSDIQKKASHAIPNCKSSKFDVNISLCPDCGHMELHNNSRRNWNCPCCQAVQKGLWVDKRKAGVIDALYFHLVFTLPHELNPLLYCNHQLLYGSFRRCCAETLLKLSKDQKYLGAPPVLFRFYTPGIRRLDAMYIWIVSGGGLTPKHKIRKSKEKYLSATKNSPI